MRQMLNALFACVCLIGNTGCNTIVRNIGDDNVVVVPVVRSANQRISARVKYFNIEGKGKDGRTLYGTLFTFGFFQKEEICIWSDQPQVFNQLGEYVVIGMLDHDTVCYIQRSN